MRKKTKRWLAALMTVFLCMGAAEMTMPMTVKAAQNSDTMTVTTTQRCSIWSAPVTAEENRVKYVDAGYQITVYPEVIQSELGDGKTFYRTVRGSYVLCRCVEGAVGNGAGTAAAGGAANGDNVAVLLPVPPMPEPSVLAGRIGVRWEENRLHDSDGWHSLIKEYDASGNRIRTTEYGSDGSITSCTVYDYDAMGNEIKWTEYGADGITVKALCINEYDAQGNRVKYAYVNYDCSELKSYDHVAQVVESEYNAVGNKVKEWCTDYYPNGRIESDFYEWDPQGNYFDPSDSEEWNARSHEVKTINTYYNADRTLLASYVFKYEYDAAGNRINQMGTLYDVDGTTLASRSWVYEYEYDAAGKHVNETVTYYDANGVPAKEYRDYERLDEIFKRDWLGIW